jgi:Uma2 family endonuclease
MSAIPKAKLSPAEYLEMERASDTKHEYLDGEIFAMAGAKFNHTRITSSLNALVWHQLRGGPCETVSGDMRVFVPKTGLYTYPDIVVVCEKPVFQDKVFDTLLNPVLLIEVLSDSTEGYDRGKKFQHYRSIESLKEYVLVSADEARIEKFVKQGDGFWVLSEAIGLESTVKFESVDLGLALADVYERIDFTDEQSA